MKLILAFLFLSSGAFAQTALLPEIYKPVPDLEHAHEHQIVQNASHVLNPISKTQIENLAKKLSEQFQKAKRIATANAPACEEKNLEEYTSSLHTMGEFQKLSEIVTACQEKISGPSAFLKAALAEASQYHYSQAEAFFKMATESKWNQNSDYAEAVFEFASYSLYGHLEQQVDGILNHMPNSSDADKKMWKLVLKRAGQQDLGPVSKPEVDAFLQKQIPMQNSNFQSLLISLQARILYIDYKYTDSLQVLINNADAFTTPLHWYSTAYSATYFGMDQNFAWARLIYQAYDAFSNPWMSFPTENNTYNYTQIYGSVCSNQLVQKNQAPDFHRIKLQLRKGEITVEQAHLQLQNLWNQLQGKADYLAAFAGIKALQSQHQAALDLYWQAHQLCPFYNRANWGLTLQKRYFQYSNRPDFESLATRVDQELENRVIPPVIGQYIINWNSLNGLVQKRVAYGARIWLPYMEALKNNDKYSYIKYAWDLLSESPSLEQLKDVRIGGANYPNDNRLWDDVRGVGGSRVVADLAEVFHTVHGDYNLLGHEVAHQFQYLMEEVYQPGFQCIVKQYDQAKLDKNFPDSYSAYNKEEHFAQGLTYFMVPADSPSRFGLNQSWVERNNPAQFRFLESIEQSKGNFQMIGCD